MTEDPLAKRPAENPYDASSEPTQFAGGQQPPPAPSYGAPQQPPAYGQPPSPYAQPGASGQPGGGFTPSPAFGGAPSGPYYVQSFQGEQGPLDLGQLAQMAVTGQLRGDSPVRSDQGTFQAKQIPGLFSDKEWLTALILAILLGGFGVDRFYLGYTGLGIAKIAVTLVTCGIGGLIWAIIDIIAIATRKLPDVNGRPLA
jgi:TM2 domain-containing membrane protein YozV